MAESSCLLGSIYLNDGSTKFRAVAGSVLDYQGDAIVNAANEGCVSGFGIDMAINKACGKRIKAARQALNGCLTGQAKVTNSFDLDCVQHVIRTYGTNVAREWFQSKDDLLRSAYRNALLRAQKLELSRVGFCLLLAGVFRGQRNLRDFVQIAVDALREAAGPSFRGITLHAFTEEEQCKLRQVMADLSVGER